MFRRRAFHEGGALLARAHSVHLATVSASGRPRLASVRSAVIHGVLVLAADRDDGVAADLRDAVVSAEETVMSLGALRYRMTARAEGRLLAMKADASADAQGANVPPAFALSLAEVTFSEDLGQDASLEERREVLQRLWLRGEPGDAAAIALLLDRAPELGVPSFLQPPPELVARGIRLGCDVAEEELDEAVDLLEGLYWLGDLPRARIRASIVASTAVVCARGPSGELVAFARAVSDGKTAWIYDVVVTPSLRGSHVGAAVMRLLLDHPAVRSARHVRLATRDAMAFYRRLGFWGLAERPRHPWESVEMIRSPAPTSEGADDPEAVRAAGPAEDRHQHRAP